MIENNLLVAIWMVTYNHENYIEKAIESIMMQECDFSYKLYIGEDFSSDKTRQICKRLKTKYSNKIELVLNSENFGAVKNSFEIFNRCKKSNAKYIAICEGDDYWTDPYKLQKQVNFLENNLDYSVCGSYCDVLYNYGMVKRPNEGFNSFTYYDIIKSNPIPTLSILYRNIINDYTFITNSIIGDIPLLFELTKTGMKGAKLPFVSGVYRYHCQGIYSGNSRFQNTKEQLKIKYFFSTEFDDKKYKIYFKKYLIKLCAQELIYLLKFNFKLFEIKILTLVIKYLIKIR